MRPRKKVLEVAILVVVALGLVAAREWLPYEGWELVLRWALAIMVMIGGVLWLGDLVVSSAREFRRGLSEDEAGRS